MADDSGSDTRIRDGYAARAGEYTELFGDIGQMDDVDRGRIGRWADGVGGRILDAGCGPGHWTAFLADRGADVEGIDLVPDFIAGASARFPQIPYRVASLTDVAIPADSLGGVLAWYSLIHTPPEEMDAVLAEFARAVAPGGGLLVGFCRGPRVEPFDHAVTTAWYWPVDELARRLDVAGFDVVEAAARTDPGVRPHGAISARRRAELSA